MLTPNGNVPGAGCIGELYQRLGGVVSWIGKPHPAIYEVALAQLGEPARVRVAGVGDSVEHDIAGARGVGCRAWLVRAGIIAGADDAAISAECARYAAEPDGVLDAFA
jgi:ribonucleotide monophosphatase NagD (HAD superfamily)